MVRTRIARSLASVVLSAALAIGPVGAQAPTDTPTSGPSDFNFRVKLDGSSKGPVTPEDPDADMRVTIFGPLSGRVNQPFEMAAAASNAPNPSVNWQEAPDSAPIPAGLEISRTSGTISGVRQAPGLTPILKIRATSAAKTADSPPFRILFRDAGATGTATIAAGPGTVGTSYAVTGSTSGIDGSPTWAVASGQLPAGLALSPTGTISGTPERAGTWSGIALVATGVNDAAITPTFSITISEPAAGPLAVHAANASGNVGTFLRATAVATGGRKPYAFAMTAGAVPPGMAFDAASASLQGVPTSTGTWAGITIAATDAGGATATATLSVTVGERLPFSLSAQQVHHAVAGSPKAVYVTPVGAQGAVTYALSAGTLPPGMSHSTATGAISGTPTQEGTWDGIIVTGTDTGSRSASTQPITIIVEAAPPFAVYAPLGTVPFNVEKTFQVTTSVAASYTYAWVPGSAPQATDGVTLDPATGAIKVKRNVAGTTGYYRVAATQTSGPQAGKSANSNTFYFNVQSTGRFEVSMPDEIGPATVGEPYSVAFGVRGLNGTGPVTGPIVWTTSSALPAGIRLDPESGRLEGVASAASNGLVGVNVKATDAEGRTADAPFFYIQSAYPTQVAWETGYPKSSYSVRQGILFRGRQTHPEPNKARIDSWSYRSWEADYSKRRTVSARVYLKGSASKLAASSTYIGGTLFDYQAARTRYKGQPGYQMGWGDKRISQPGDPDDTGEYTVALVLEDARGKPAATSTATFRIAGPLTLRDYLSRPATDTNWQSNYQYGTCSYGATYVPAGTDGVEGLDEVRVVTVPGAYLSLKPLFNNDPDGTAMPYFVQMPWPGNEVPELPPQQYTTDRHQALGLYGGGSGVSRTQAPGFYKNVVAIYDGFLDVYTYYNVKTMVNPPGTSCNTSQPGSWNN